jgi:DNA repair and recombination protein RAD52
MGFTPEQERLLKEPLNSRNVKSRSQSGRSLSYIEGWHAIDEANRIFGFGAWSRETIHLMEVCRYEVDKKDKTGAVIGKQWKIGYEAKVRVTAGGISREGTGHGQGTMGDLFDAMESAAKEAETDAMKRALMTFGNQFGLALYDKEQNNVQSGPTEAEKAQAALQWATEVVLGTKPYDEKKAAAVAKYPEAAEMLKQYKAQ